MQTEMTKTPRKLKFTKFGLAENPLQLHCSMTYQGREYLGVIIGREYDEQKGFTYLTIRHFNGEPWKDKEGKELKPTALSVDILDGQP